MLVGIIELVIGCVVTLAGLVTGLIRLIKNPTGWNFSKAAFIRYLIFMLIAIVGGVALIIFGSIAIRGSIQ